MQEQVKGENTRKAGPYTIYLDVQIGFGQQGVVFKASKEGLPFDICCKIISISKDNPQALAAVSREIKILKSLNNINNECLIKVYDVFENADLSEIMIFMEYCECGDLKRTMEEKKKAKQQYCYEEIRVFIRDIVLAYRTLYENNIIHRDIKPANILLQKSGRYKLADFGLGKVIEDVTESIFHTKVGTPVYAAPQLFQNGETSKFSSKCDVYSLGIIIYEMTYMELPFVISLPHITQFQSKINNHPFKCPMPKIEGTAEQIQQLKELIESMITNLEAKRISWPELFEHPLVTFKPDKQSNPQIVQKQLIENQQPKCNLYDSVFYQNNQEALQFDYTNFTILSGMKDSTKSSRLQHFLKITLAKSMICKALLDLFQSKYIIGLLQERGINTFQYNLLKTCLLGYQNKILINAFGFSYNQMNYIAMKIKQLFDQNHLQIALNQLHQDMSQQCIQIKKQILLDVQQSNQIFIEQQNRLIILLTQHQYKSDISNFKKLLGLLQDKIEYALYGSWFKFFYNHDFRSILIYETTKPYPIEYLRFIALSEYFIGLETTYPLNTYLSQSPQEISGPIQYQDQQLKQFIEQIRRL